MTRRRRAMERVGKRMARRSREMERVGTRRRESYIHHGALGCG